MMRTRSLFSLFSVLPSLMATALLLGSISSLTGCAGNRVGAPTDDIATASDETNATKRASIRYELAMGYFEQGKTEVALDEVKQVLQLMPSSVDAWILRGLIYMRLNDTRLAEESFRRAQSLQPQNGAAAQNYGWLLCKLKRYDEAQAQFKRAIDVGYNGASRTYMSMGLCQVEAGQKTAAEDSFRHSLEMEPLNPISGYNLALLLYQRGQYEQARFYVRRVNNDQYANAQTLWLGVRVEHALHSAQSQQQLAAQLRSRFPDSPEAALLERGAFDE